MFKIFRKPLGFAFLFFLCEQLYSYALAFSRILYNHYSSWTAILSLGYVAPLVVAIAFTYVYVRIVKAHLSQRFRIQAVLYILLVTLVSSLAVVALNFPISPFAIRALLLSGFFWLSQALSVAIHYVGISLGNRLASPSIKTQAHI